MVLWDYVPNKSSRDDVIQAMKENLELVGHDEIKEFHFSINSPYEKEVIGEGPYSATGTYRLLPDFTGDTEAQARATASRLGISVSFKGSGGTVDAQSEPANKRIDLMKGILTLTLSGNSTKDNKTDTKKTETTDKDKDKDKDKDSNKRHRNSVNRHMISMKQYHKFSLKKHSMQSSKQMKKMKTNLIKPTSEMSLKLSKDPYYHKKSNKNLRHNELEKSIIKKHSYNSNMHIPRIMMNIKTQENDTNDIHLVVNGNEEKIINYTNQQMIEDEKDYMIDCLKVLAKLKKEEAPRCKQKVNFNFPPEENQKKIALFDLDETLVHCNNNEP
jgi:hypothetical protein